MGFLFNAFMMTANLLGDAAGALQRRFRNVAAVATFPLVTPRADDPKLWASCARVAWRGLWSPHPHALDYFVQLRGNVERTRAKRELATFMAGRLGANLSGGPMFRVRK